MLVATILHFVWLSLKSIHGSFVLFTVKGLFGDANCGLLRFGFQHYLVYGENGLLAIALLV